MRIKYDWPDMPIGTPLEFGGILVLNGKVMEVSQEDQKRFKATTGLTLTRAARNNAQLTIPRKKVN